MKASVAAAFFVLALVAIRGNAAVYKCDDGTGGIIYSQNPCAADAQKLDIEGTAAEATSSPGTSGLREKEREMLQEFEDERAARAAAEREARAKAAEAKRQRINDKKICDSTRIKLAKVNRRLRYRNRQHLRDKANEYEEVVKEHCR